MVVDHRFAFKLPPALHRAKSVPLLSSGLTVYTGIAKAQLPANSVVGVLGAGGLGYVAIQFLNKMGHRVYAFSHSPGKKEMIQQLERQPVALGLLYDYAQRTIYGNYVGSRKDMMDMLDLSAKHDIGSDVEVMPFSRMNEAIEKVRAGKVRIRLVLENQE